MQIERLTAMDLLVETESEETLLLHEERINRAGILTQVEKREGHYLLLVPRKDLGFARDVLADRVAEVIDCRERPCRIRREKKAQVSVDTRGRYRWILILGLIVAVLLTILRISASL